MHTLYTKALLCELVIGDKIIVKLLYRYNKGIENWLNTSKTDKHQENIRFYKSNFLGVFFL